MKATSRLRPLFAVLMLCLMALALAACSAATPTPPPATATPAPTSAPVDARPLEGISLKIGTSGLFGPFSYYDADGTTLIGYDIELLGALQEKLGFDIDGGLQAMSYSALTTSVTQGMLDVAAAALCATDERKLTMDFSQTYCDSGQALMVNKDANSGIRSIEDLAGKKVAVEKGTASHTYAAKHLESKATIEVHDTITTAYASLELNKVDAVIQDGPGIAFYIKTNPTTKLQMVGEEFNQGQAPYAIAYVKDFKYAQQFNDALADLDAEGVLEALYVKWAK